MSSPKRHHYLPQFYLRGFCRDGAFWIFDRERNEFRIQTPINTTVQTHYCSYRREDGSLDARLEVLFSEVEALTAPVIEKVEGGKVLSSDEKSVLSVFAGLQQFRIPDYERLHHELRQGILGELAGNVAPATDEEIAKAPGVVPPDEAGPRVSAFELVKELEELEKDSSLAHNDFLDMIIPLTSKISEVLLTMSWTIVHAPSETSFITTDCPFQTLPPPDFDPTGLEGYGIGTPGSLKIMPLSRKCCLFVRDQGSEFAHGSATRKQVRHLNLALVTACDNYVIAGDEQQARYLVKKIGIDKSRRGPRIVVQ